VGNWAGVTVEKKEGFLNHKGYEIHFVDLPGIYTLEPLSEDEWIAYHFITDEKPDVVLDVIETTNAERDLLLTTELLELGMPTVIALNMSDEAEKRGIEVDEKHTSELLDVPVVKTNGRNGDGVQELLDTIVSAAENARPPKALKYSEKMEESLEKFRRAGRSVESTSARCSDY